MFSQYEEEKIITEFFKDSDPEKMTFLDIGANDGITFSNTHRLALMGWKGACLDPSPSAFDKLQNLYKDNPKIKCFNFGISDKNGEIEFNESLNWIDDENTPVGILSCINSNEKNRFYGMNWRVVKSKFFTFYLFLSAQTYKKFDFINIDCEGHDLIILTQINLNEVGCKMVCIEFTDESQIELYQQHFSKYSFELHYKTKDNLLFTKSE